jgi:hypothetical protein
VIENPQPLWLPLLLLALPGIGVASYALNKALFPSDDRPVCTVPAIGLVLTLLPTHALALALGSLSIGLAVAWSITGGAGYAWFSRHWREFRCDVSIWHAVWARRLGIAALATLPIILPTIVLNFHDEVNFHSHQGIMASLQNGTYPPRYLYEPSLALRYHYAFDLAGAIITGLLRVRLDHAIDLLTLGLWPCMFLLLWRVGEHVGRRKASLAVALAVCFSGGFAAVARSFADCGLCTVNGLRVTPAFISYFFQHPWSIGVPIFCLVILQRAALPTVRNQLLGVSALLASLMLLSLSEVVLFAATVITLGLTEAWNFLRWRARGAATILLTLGASLIGARLVGGFFAPGSYPPAGGLFDTGFYLRDFSGAGAILGQAQWNLASFGFLLPLGIAGLSRVKREKPFLATLVALILLIVNLLSYRHTSEINKFAAVALIVLGIGAGIILSDLAHRADTRIRKVIYVLLVTIVIWQGTRFPSVVLLAYNADGRPPFSNQMIKPYLSTAYPVDQDDASAVSFLRTHMSPSEIVYRAAEKSEPYVIWGGLPAQVTWYLYATEREPDDVYGLGAEKFAGRQDLARISDDWFDRLVAEHVTWLVADDDDVAINSVLECPEGQRRALLAARYGKVRVYRLQ